MLELYPHQKEALKKLKNGSILWGGVGSGKSLTAVQYYLENEAPKDVIVITTAKKRDSLDWDREFAGCGMVRAMEGSAGPRFLVDSWNNIDRYRDRQSSFFIFDEQRVVGSGKWAKDFIRIATGSGNRWLLLSATPGDTWLDYIPVFIANGFYRNRSQFLDEHVIYNRFSKFPKVQRYVGVNKLVRLRNFLLVHMPYEKLTTRVVTSVPVSFDEALQERILVKRWNVLKNKPLRDVAELFQVMRQVVYGDASRLSAVRKLMEEHPRIIVFYNFNSELEVLRGLATSADTVEGSGVKWQSQKPAGIELSYGKTSTEAIRSTIVPAAGESPQKESGSITQWTTQEQPSFQLAEWNGHKHQPIPETDRWVYLVQYTAGAEGWNCVDTNAMIFYSLTYSYKIFEQAMGRIDRLNTPFTKLFYYVLMSNSKIDKMVWSSLSKKQSFNEAKIAKSRSYTIPDRVTK